nr:unnamed protein product [Spirometra erinaceieuropaei]
MSDARNSSLPPPTSQEVAPSPPFTVKPEVPDLTVISKAEELWPAKGTVDHKDTAVWKSGDRTKNSPDLSKRTCGICGRTFTTAFSVRRHVEVIHSGLEKQTFKCEICQAEFKCKQSRHDHVAFVHEGSLNLKCEICQTVFALKHCLKRHIATIHENPSSFECDICHTLLRTKQSLKRHVAEVHEAHRDSFKRVRLIIVRKKCAESSTSLSLPIPTPQPPSEPVGKLEWWMGAVAATVD